MIAASLPWLLASFGLVGAPFAAASPAGEPAPPGNADRAPWTLARVLEAARQNSPAVRAARAAGKAGAAEGAGAWSALLPQVSLRGGLTRTDDPAVLFSQRLQQGRFTQEDFAIDALNQPAARNALEYGLVVEQPLWNGAAEITAPSMASRTRREADAASRAAVADALLDAVRRYVGYVGARETSSADSLAVDAARAAHQAAVERHRLGQVPDLDTLRTFARVAEERDRLYSSLNERDLARRRLGDAIGTTPADAEIASPEDAQAATFLAEGAATAERDTSTIGPPAVEASRARADRLGLEATRAGQRLLPSLNGRFALSYYRDPDAGGAAEQRWFAGLSVDWPIFDGMLRWNEKKAAAARADGARADYAAMRLEWNAHVEAARRDLEIAEPRRDAARAARRASDEALRLAESRYRAGLLPLDDLLAVGAEAARARERNIAREAELQLAGYTYLHAIGRLR